MTTKRGVVADVRVPHPMLDEAGFVDALVARGRELGGFPTFTVDELARKAFAMVIFAKRCGKL